MGTGLIVDNMILEGSIPDPSLCDRLIDLSESRKAFNAVWECEKCGSTAKNYRAASFDWLLAPEVYPEVKELHDVLTLGIDNYLSTYSMCGLDDMNLSLANERWNLQFYLPKTGYPSWHSEWQPRPVLQTRVLTWMLYLNDVPDAGTEWLFQDHKTEAIKGNLVFWPAYFSHTHRGIISQTDEKWIATGWISAKSKN